MQIILVCVVWRNDKSVQNFNQEFQKESDRLEDSHVDKIMKLHYNYTKSMGR